MPKLNKSFSLEAPIQEVWDSFINITELARCVPGCQDVHRVDDKTAVVDVKIKIGFVSHEDKIKNVIVEQVPLKSIVANGEGESVRVITNLAFNPNPANEQRTDVAVGLDITAKGVLAKLIDVIISERSDKMVQEFVDCLSAKIAANRISKQSAAPAS